MNGSVIDLTKSRHIRNYGKIIISRYTGKRVMDLTGKRFGHLVAFDLTVPYRSPSGKSFATRWICRCDCGRYTVVTTFHLNSGHTKSCGNPNCNFYMSPDNLVGQRFDRLTVVKQLSPIVTHRYRKDRRGMLVTDRDYVWLCKCTCGRYCKRRGSVLKYKKAGHMCDYCKKHGFRIPASDEIDNTIVRQAKSSNEYAVIQYLFRNHVDFSTEQSFPGLVGRDNFDLRYDICINTKPLVLIELNGVQHYKPLKFFGGEKMFKLQVQHDKEKEVYAERHGYEFYSINCVGLSCSEVVQQIAMILK